MQHSQGRADVARARGLCRVRPAAAHGRAAGVVAMPSPDPRAYVRIYFATRNHPLHGRYNRRLCRYWIAEARREH